MFHNYTLAGDTGAVLNYTKDEFNEKVINSIGSLLTEGKHDIKSLTAVTVLDDIAKSLGTEYFEVPLDAINCINKQLTVLMNN